MASGGNTNTNVQRYRAMSASAPLNPEVVATLKESMGEDPNQACAIVIFGASGDLAKKKVIPSLWWLYRDDLLPAETWIVGYARSNVTMEKLRASFENYCKVHDAAERKKFEEFVSRCSYIKGRYDNRGDYEKLWDSLEELERQSSIRNGQKVLIEMNCAYYMAVPPGVVKDIVPALCPRGNMPGLSAWRRLIIEKPFGHDTESSAELSDLVAKYFREDQTYRIDHYLGKEMVQNLMVLRFGNRIFEPTWNREHIACVVISVKEDIGTMGRAGYFNEAGIIRDVMQNHIMQMVSIIAMEQPVELDAQVIGHEKEKVLRAIKHIELSDVVLGQYVKDPKATEGEARFGYLDDESVPNDSITPTYALAVLKIDNKRWEGVPFILRCGKALNERKTEIRIQYKDVPNDIYGSGQLKRSELVIRIQPDEAVYMKLMTKKPGLGFQVEETELDLTYNSRFKGVRFPDAYERLLLDVVMGSQVAFVGKEELALSWEIFTPLLKEIERSKIKPIEYVFGSRGPEEADEKMQQNGFVFTGTYKWTPPQPKI